MTTAAAQLANAMSEAELQHNVMDAAKKLGWRCYHNRKTARVRGDGTVVHHTSYTGDGGFLDLLLARAGKVIIPELKSQKGKLSADQKLWIAALGGLRESHRGHHCSDLYVYVWRPSHWLSGEIEEALR